MVSAGRVGQTLAVRGITEVGDLDQHFRGHQIASQHSRHILDAAVLANLHRHDGDDDTLQPGEGDVQDQRAILV